MYFYIILLIIIFLLYLVLYKIKYTDKSKFIFCISVFALFALIQGLRANDVGTDTAKYIKYFNMNNNISFSQVLTKESLNFEVGFGMLLKIISITYCPAQVFLMIVAIIINGRSYVFHL